MGKTWKLNASLYFRTGTVIQKTHLLLTNYCCYRYCCFRLHIQKDNIPGKKERKKNKNQRNQQPLSPPQAISHLFVSGKFCSKDWNRMYSKPSACRKASEPMQCSHSVDMQPAQGFWKTLNMLLVNGSFTCLLCLFGPPPDSEVRCVAWPSKNIELHCLIWRCVGVGHFFFSCLEYSRKNCPIWINANTLISAKDRLNQMFALKLQNP